MEWLNTLITFIVGLGLRLAIPIAVTAVVIYFLRRLDAHWQAEAERQPPALAAIRQPCWEIVDCPPERRKACPVPKQTQPCWQVFRRENGYLREACLHCDVFRQAPVPTGA